MLTKEKGEKNENLPSGEHTNAEVYHDDRPIIGIPIHMHYGDQGPVLLADGMGTWAIERMRGRIFLIPIWPFPTHAHLYQSLWPLLEAMDGLFLPSSVQDSNWYEQLHDHSNSNRAQHWSISWEMALAQLVTSIGMPILSLGEGAKKWNVALGGTLEPPVEHQSPSPLFDPDTWEHYAIRVRTPSKLADSIQQALMKCEEPISHQPWKLLLPSREQNGTLAPGLRPCAQSEHERTIAFELKDPSFGLGIIARADWGLDQVYSTILFESFFQACRDFASARQEDEHWGQSRDTICDALYARTSQGLPILTPFSQGSVQIHALTEEPPLLENTSSIWQPSHKERVRTSFPTREELNKKRRQRLKKRDATNSFVEVLC